MGRKLFQKLLWKASDFTRSETPQEKAFGAGGVIAPEEKEQVCIATFFPPGSQILILAFKHWNLLVSPHVPTSHSGCSDGTGVLSLCCNSVPCKAQHCGAGTVNWRQSRSLRVIWGFYMFLCVEQLMGLYNFRAQMRQWPLQITLLISDKEQCCCSWILAQQGEISSTPSPQDQCHPLQWELGSAAWDCSAVSEAEEKLSAVVQV